MRCGVEGFAADAEAISRLVDLAEGDARAVLTTLEVAMALARARARAEGGRRPRGAAANDHDGGHRGARETRAFRHGREEHYDLISALIKSLRGSDPDAGLYWMARLIEAGEDPRYVARRLVILASEDVGMADPHALGIATAAAQAVEFVGLPRRALNLAQAVVHLALAPKSNRVALAWWAAQADVREQPARAGVRQSFATRTTAVPRHWATGWATSILTMTREGSWKLCTCPKGLPGAATTSLRTMAPKRCSPSAGGRERAGGRSRSRVAATAST